MGKLYNDLKELHEAIESCRICLEKDYPVVNIQPPWDPARGRLHKQKWVMVIAQAPGKTEMERGLAKKHAFTEREFLRQDNPNRQNESDEIAFTGPTGKRQKQWFLDAGFAEAEIKKDFYKTSVVKCYPGKARRGKGDRPPSRVEVELCRNFLVEQIRLINPQVLLPFGEFAIQWFFPGMDLKDAVGQDNLEWRGRRALCFPHASPGSRWLNEDNNKARLVLAKRLLAQEVEKMRSAHGRGSESDD